MSTARLAAIAAMAALASGCGRAPGVYDLTVHDAYARLAQNALEDFVFKRQCGILVHLVPEGVPDQQVTWRVYSSGEELLDFTARLSPVGGKQTRVAIDIAKDADGTEAYNGNKFYPHPAFHQPLRPALEAAIGAILDGKPFDVMEVPRGGDNESVCNVQRAGLEETGRAFNINDKPGEWGGR